MTVIRLPDKQTAELKTKATAEGLPHESWLQLADQKHPARHRQITKMIVNSLRYVPPEVLACKRWGAPRRRSGA